MDKAKNGKKKVRYWISYRLKGGKQRRESVGAYDDLDAYSITDAKVADSKRKVQKTEKRFLEMVQGYDLTFDDLFKWYLGSGTLFDILTSRIIYATKEICHADQE